MDKIKKVYIDSRYKASDSTSNTSLKFELKGQFPPCVYCRLNLNTEPLDKPGAY